MKKNKIKLLNNFILYIYMFTTLLKSIKSEVNYKKYGPEKRSIVPIEIIDKQIGGKITKLTLEKWYYLQTSLDNLNIQNKHNIPKINPGFYYYIRTLNDNKRILIVDEEKKNYAVNKKDFMNNSITEKEVQKQAEEKKAVQRQVEEKAQEVRIKKEELLRKNLVKQIDKVRGNKVKIPIVKDQSIVLKSINFTFNNINYNNLEDQDKNILKKIIAKVFDTDINSIKLSEGSLKVNVISYLSSSFQEKQTIDKVDLIIKSIKENDKVSSELLKIDTSTNVSINTIKEPDRSELKQITFKYKDIKLSEIDSNSLKEILASKFNTEISDIIISQDQDNMMVSLVAKEIDEKLIRDNAILAATDSSILQIEIIDINIEEITNLTYLEIKLINNYIESLPEVKLDFDPINKSLGEIKKVIDELGNISIPKTINDQVFELSNLANVFDGYKTSVSKAIDSYDIGLAYAQPTIIQPPVKNNSTAYLDLYKSFIEDYTNTLENFKAEKDLPGIKRNIRKRNEDIASKIGGYNEQIKNIKLIIDNFKKNIFIEDYLSQQPENISVRLAGIDYKHNLSNQDLVFFNGTKEELEKEVNIPIEDIHNSFVSSDKSKKNELSQYLIGDIAYSIKFDDIDLFTIPKNKDINQINSFEEYIDKVKYELSGGFRKYKINYYGGEIKEEAQVLIDSTKGIGDELLIYNTNIINLKKKIIELQDIIYDFNLLYIQTIFYHFFMTNAISNNIIAQEQMVYNLISIGNCQYYLNVINIILSKIDSGNISSAERYFQKYHYILLLNYKLLFNYIIREKEKNTSINAGKDTILNEMESLIDVNFSQGKIRYMLFTFNTFKDLLDAYRSQKLPSVSVYIRINDWGKKPDNYVFTRNKGNSQIMNVNVDNCGLLDKRLSVSREESKRQFNEAEYLYNKIKSIKVEEVYDTQNFKDNGVISKYMSLPVQLSQKKGIMLVTYGYSGTGKTFSLFGNGTINGLLQTTLLEIRGQSKIYFRIYELYSMGVQYNFYWENPEKIYQRLYTYNLKTTNGKLKVKSVNEKKTFGDIKNFIKEVEKFKEKDFSDINSYIEIDYSIFKNFSDFTSIIDLVREKKHPTVSQPKDFPCRIKPTANNPVSSRSILIYDFQIVLNDGTVVPFVIVDLPGKENIEQSYIQNEEFTIDGDDRIYPTISASFLLNPIFAPLYKQEYTDKIIKFIKNNFDDNSTNLRNKWLQTEIYTILGKSGSGTVTSSSVNEYINSDMTLTSNARKWKGTGIYLGPESGNIQRYNNVLVYFISMLIKEGRIDILVKLISELVTENDNMGKITKINEVGETENIYDNLEEKIKLAYEGVAINENILGLVYTMISKIKINDNEYKNPAYDIKSQIDKSDLDNISNDRKKISSGYSADSSIIDLHNENRYLKENEADIMARIARTINKSIYKNDSNPNIEYSNEEYSSDSRINKSGLNLYQKSIETYDPERIYSVQSNDNQEPIIQKDKIGYDKKPIIHKLLSPYIDEDKSGKSIIDNIYIFYLLTNNDSDKKCKNQIDLLVSAKNFLKALDPLD